LFGPDKDGHTEGTSVQSELMETGYFSGNTDGFSGEVSLWPNREAPIAPPLVWMPELAAGRFNSGGRGQKAWVGQAGRN